MKENGARKLPEPNGGGPSDATRKRTGGPSFEPSFRALRDVVQMACAPEREWQVRIVLGLRAALEFAANNPAAARAVTIQARGIEMAAADREDEVLAYFAGLLAAVAPAEKRVAISSEAGLVDSIATIVRAHLLAEDPEKLRASITDLVYLTLVPYTSLVEARRWASAAPGL